MIRTITPELRRHILTARDAQTAAGGAALSDSYDACVIGSGPGGAVAAATLAEAGQKVLLVERGPFLAPEQFNFRVLDQSSRLGHLELTSGFRTLLYQGNLLGGSSVLYGAVAMKPPDYVFDDWKKQSGLDWLDLAGLKSEYDYVGRILSVTRQSTDKENRSNAIVREMAAALGRPDGLELVERYTQGCAGVGLCNLGCGFDLKGTTLNSFVPMALQSGNLTILTECEAVSLSGQQSGGRFAAAGVGVVLRDFQSGQVVRRALVRARRVFVAGGAFFSSALLLRSSGLAGCAKIGARVYLQPHAQIFALFDEPVTRRGILNGDQYLPYNGVPAIYNFTGFLREHRFFWLASILFPASLATFVSHLPPEEHQRILRRFHYAMSITLTVRDDPDRSRVRLRDGRGQLDFRESRQDLESFRQCFLLAARSMLAVGARRVFLPMLRPPRIESSADLKQIETMGFQYSDLVLYSDHTSGGNPLGADSTRGVTDSSGRLFGSDNVYVADSSLFPSACGINPSWTIMALARRISKELGARG